MSRLKILLRGAQISEIGLSPDREYIGGRKESCDIRLQPEKGISREHFSLKFEDGQWKIQSLSRFGEIFSTGQRLQSGTLEHGQSFQIPPYEFLFSDTNDEVSPQNVNDTPVDVSETEKTVVGVTQQMPFIKMMSSQGEIREMLRLEFGEIWVAGRDSSCQIIIPDQRVSRRQFEIRKINGIYTIIDMDSVNGTFLNGTVVSSTDPLPLKSGDAITVLDNTMYFELHDPNFQYRMDRIEIPAFQVPSEIEDIDYNQIADQNFVQDSQPLDAFQQNQLDDNQLNINGSPFTGMPQSSGASQENQFYSFQPSAKNPDVKPNLYQKIKSSKPLLISLVLVILGGAYYLNEFINEPDKKEVAETTQNTKGDPFSQLSSEKQKQVQELYEKAQSEMVQSKYDMAKESLEKLHSILPTGYQDSLQKLEEVILNEQTIIAQKAQEEAEKNRLESEEKIKKITAECEKLISPEVTEDKMANCLTEALMTNPEHPDILRLKNKVKELVDSRKNKTQEKEAYEAKVKELDKIFETAESLRKAGLPYKAIKAYEVVTKSNLPDPKKLKLKSETTIKYIDDTIKKHTEDNLKNADLYIKDGKFKLAVKALNDAIQYDPDNKNLKEKSEKYTNELRLQAMVIYQESIIDESFGYVEGNETRPGAKDKWKKIIDMDLEDGEYYRKAFVKLKKYGVF